LAQGVLTSGSHARFSIHSLYSSMSSGSPVVMFIDFFDQMVKGQEKARQNLAVCVSYVVFALLAGVVAMHFSDLDFSAVLTAGAGAQFFGFYLLLQKAQSTHSVAGISSKTLELFVLVFLFRLPCTCLRNGYLPVDRSGDWVYQVADFSSLLIIIQLIYCIQKKYAATYQHELDSLPVWNAVPACIVGAVVLHGDLNHSFFYDTMWTISMNLETIAMLPQLWMLVKKGGEVEALTSNYVAALFMTSCLKMSFWFYGHEEIGDEDNPTTYEMVARYWVAGCHVMQVLLSADFMMHYFKAHANRAGSVKIPDDVCNFMMRRSMQEI